jgi:hypothetical protein
MYLPDLSYFLNSIAINTKINQIDTLRMIQKKLNIKISNKGSKIITMCLSRHIYHEGYTNNYTNIIKSISEYIAQIIVENYHVMLLPFNTNKDCDFENDIIVNNDILQCLKEVYKLDYTKYMTVIDKTLEPCDVNSLLSISYMVIPMRFHACLLSIYNNIPILPIFTTRKITNLLLDIKWTDYYKLPTNEHDIPVSLSSETLMEKTKSLITNYNIRVNDLNKTNTYFFGKDMTSMITRFINLINMPYDKIYKDKPIIHFVSNSDIIKNLYEKIINLIEYKGFKELHNIDEKTKNLIVSIVSYHLAEKNINSSYNYGLKEKMFLPNYNYIEEWLWILNDNNSKCKPITLESNTNGLFNINYLDQIDYSGVHRSGWQYVFENISYLHDDNHPLLLDMYLDRTFTWNSEINEILNFIPYKKSWIGFIHHTFDTSFSKNNCYTMFENPLFIESLKCCKGLFVLSRYLLKLTKDYLQLRNIKVPVFYIMHPTDIQVEKFTITKFINNNEKKLLHIGGWLRDIYSFYDLNIQCINVKYKKLFNFTKKYNIEKYALKGKHMNNYYPESTFLHCLYHTLQTNNNNNCQGNVSGQFQGNVSSQCEDQDQCQGNVSCNVSDNIIGNVSCNVSDNIIGNVSCNVSDNIIGNVSCNVSDNIIGNVSCQGLDKINNNWYRHLFSDFKNKILSVKFINHLTDSQFDSILTNNIVFLNLIDASATNTVIECIVRNTPIIINKHPAIIELLGDNYPLFYKDKMNYNEITNAVRLLISDGNAIENASIYLSKINNEIFSINTFQSSFTQLLKQV